MEGKKNLTPFEQEALKLYKSNLRLTAPRELYTRVQAAHRLNVSVNSLDDEYVIPYKMKIVIRRGKAFIPHAEIKRVIREELEKNIVHRKAVSN